jgi:hypothetical protein
MDAIWVQTAVSVGVGISLAAAAGLRVFLPLLALGCAARFGALPLVDNLDWIASWPGLATLGVATAVEIGAYYVPWLDNALDLIAGPLAVAAGVLAMAAVTTELPPAVRWTLAIVAGGGTAGAVQGLTSIGRLKSTALTAGLGNPVLATVELVGALVLSIAALVAPVIAVVLVVALLVAIGRLGRRGFRAIVR